MVAIFVQVVASCLYFVLFTVLFMRCIEATTELHMRGAKRTAVVAGLLCIVMIAAPTAYFMSEPTEPLCLRGHEEYVNYTRPPMLVGKVLMPGGPATSRVWVCEQREVE